MTNYIILIISFLLYQNARADIIKISTGEFPPMTSKDSKNGGYVLDLITRAFKEVGHEVKYTYMPWKRALANTKDGEFSASAYWVCTKERLTNFYCSDTSVMKSQYVFFHLKTLRMKNWKELSDLKDYRIGITRGYFYSPTFLKLKDEHGLIIDEAKSDSQNFKKLLRRRIDIFPIDIVPGYSILRKNFSSAHRRSITNHYKVIFENHSKLLFPKSKKESVKLKEEFEKGLKILKEQGTIDKMYNDLVEGVYE